MLCTSVESTFEHARPFFLKLESIALSIPLTPYHATTCFLDTTEIYPKCVSCWTLGQI